MNAALELAHSVASNCTVPIKLARHALDANEELISHDRYGFEQTSTWQLSQTEVSKEAMGVVAEKRKPEIKGR